MAAKSMDDIAELFKNLRFKKQILGGVNEKDVWKGLDRIQKEYRSAYERMQAGYEARLQERDEEIARLKEQNEEIASLQKHNEEIARLKEQNEEIACPGEWDGESARLKKQDEEAVRLRERDEKIIRLKKRDGETPGESGHE